MTQVNSNYFAKSISTIIHPLILSPLNFLILYLYMIKDQYFSFLYLALVLICIPIIPFSYVLKMKKDGEIDDIDIPDRKQRQKPFIKGTILFLIASFILIISKAPKNFTSLMLIYTINTGIATLITTYWKISVHGLAFGIPIATIGMIISKNYFYFSFLLPLLVYSRVKLKAHTISQVIAGFSLGFFMTILQIKCPFFCIV